MNKNVLPSTKTNKHAANELKSEVIRVAIDLFEDSHDIVIVNEDLEVK